MRRAQYEMIGLVLLVVLLVIAIVFFLSFGNQKPRSESSNAKAFLISFTETEVPACGTDVGTLAVQCVKGTRFCGDPCSMLQGTMNMIAKELEGYKYNISLYGTPIQNSSDCNSADLETETIAGAELTLPAGKMTLYVCR